jgi:hypothetical protein
VRRLHRARALADLLAFDAIGADDVDDLLLGGAQIDVRGRT